MRCCAKSHGRWTRHAAMTGAALADVEPKRCEDSRWGHKSYPLPLWPCPSGQLRNSWRIPPMTDWASMISHKAIP